MNKNKLSFMKQQRILVGQPVSLFLEEPFSSIINIAHTATPTNGQYVPKNTHHWGKHHCTAGLQFYIRLLH